MLCKDALPLALAILGWGRTLCLLKVLWLEGLPSMLSSEPDGGTMYSTSGIAIVSEDGEYSAAAALILGLGVSGKLRVMTTMAWIPSI